MTKNVARLELPKPLVVTLGNLKGGAAKTTSSFFLACYFALVHGLKVLVIDADPLSQTGYSWYQRLIRGGVKVPFTLIAFPSKHIGDQIDANSADYDVIIVDAGGESADIFREAVRKTHELLLLTSTSPAEYNRLPGTYVAAEEASVSVAHEIRVRVLMTRVPVVNRTNADGIKANVSVEYRTARGFLEGADYDVLQSYISVGQWYRLAADGQVGDGAENPMVDLGEYREVGDEVLAPYMVEVAA